MASNDVTKWENVQGEWEGFMDACHQSWDRYIRDFYQYSVWEEDSDRKEDSFRRRVKAKLGPILYLATGEGIIFRPRTR